MTAPDELGATRAMLGPGAALGVTEEMIDALVNSFYARVRADPELGPIFNEAVQDWEPHLARLRAFWSSVALMSGRYKGTPMQVHAQLPGIGPEDFTHWLALFGQTARDVCPPAAADFFVSRAETIARSLQFGIAASRGEPPTREVSNSDSSLAKPADKVELS